MGLKGDPVGFQKIEKDVRSERSRFRFAQLAQIQQAANVRQIFYNIMSDGGAACNGDVVGAARSVTIAKGARVLTVSEDTFASGDVGKAIVIPGGGNGGGKLFAYIRSVLDPQSVTLDRGAATGLSQTSRIISYGTDDAPKFMAFNKWARAHQGSRQVVLTVPNGAQYWFGSSASNVGLGNAWAAGMNNLLVEGTGATLSSVGGAGFWLGGRGVCQAGIASANGCSARIQTAQAGAAQITLTSSSLTAGHISRFPVGKWLMLGGLDTQGIWNAPYGFPPIEPSLSGDKSLPSIQRQASLPWIGRSATPTCQHGRIIIRVTTSRQTTADRPLSGRSMIPGTLR